MWQAQAHVGLLDARLSVDLLTKPHIGLVHTVLTLLRQVEAALAVETLPHVAASFPRSAPSWIPLTCLVPARLFEDKPDVSNPEHGVYETKNLEAEKRTGVNGFCYVSKVCLLIDYLPPMYSDVTSEALGWLRICFPELCRPRSAEVPVLGS